MFRRFILVVVLAGSLTSTMTPAHAVISPDLDCSRGSAAITFDDGPHKTNTPRLLNVLRDNHAQATFYVKGQNAKRHPELVRKMIRDGHAVENHSWDHPQLTHLSTKDVESQISRTNAVIEKITGIVPTFMRPPFGDTDARVEKAIARHHLTQSLWTIDTNDWRGGSSKQISEASLRGLRPHKTNVILMHDAVDNSPRTVKAVPSIIRALRKKGYCLKPMQTGAPSTVSGVPVKVDEGEEGTTEIAIRLELDLPSPRQGSLRVRTVPGTAAAGVDFAGIARTMTVKPGSTSLMIRVKVNSDPMPNPDKTFGLVLDEPRNVKIATKRVPVTIADNEAWQHAREELIAP